MAKRKLEWEDAQAMLLEKVNAADVQDAVYEAAMDVVSRISDDIMKEYDVESDDDAEYYDDVRDECVHIVYDKMLEFLNSESDSEPAVFEIDLSEHEDVDVHTLTREELEEMYMFGKGVKKFDEPIDYLINNDMLDTENCYIRVFN